jgi:pimeloyl-ACP methyl ester carboxylesterase
VETTKWVREEGFVVRGHRLSVPLDNDRPKGPLIQIFARELRKTRENDLPFLIYLQGGPGFEVARPSSLNGWQTAAIESFNIILLDQRGTGQSTPFESSMTQEHSDEDVAEYLCHFRADSIVKDAERLRAELLSDEQRWTILGQSFGGFCALTYLSFAPEGLERVLLTGGVPPIGKSAVEVYQALTPNVRSRTRRFYDRFTDANLLVSELCDLLEQQDYRLPNGDPFHVERLKSLGIMLGRARGGSDLYALLEMAKTRGPDGRLTTRFLTAVQRAASVVTNPIYAILHESIYCEGTASGWSAQRVKAKETSSTERAIPLYFDGEMIFPWMFDDISALKPLKGVAEILARKTDWGALYDMEQLQRNEVPIAAAVYDEDMFVDRALSLEILECVPLSRFWSTNEFEHDGLRHDGGRIFERLMSLTEDLVR